MELPDFGDVNKHVDRATEGQRKKWWKSLSSEKQLAWGVLITAGAIGPLGMSIAAALGNLYSGKVPSANQFEAVILLVFLTAPVFLGLGTLIFMADYGWGSGTDRSWCRCNGRWLRDVEFGACDLTGELLLLSLA
jgi:ABC-type spermidine/putrescine transport system permease subunit II